jgi:uncharacterized membrane protein
VVRARTDLTLVIVLALAACVFAALLPSSLALLRAPLALPLVLALPGYALLSIIFPPGRLRPAELGVLSMAVSIAVTIITGLALDLLGVALSAAPWMGLLAAITVLAAARASVLGHLRPLPVAGVVRLRALDAGALVAALILLIGAATLGFTPLAPPKSTPGTSALWLLPAPGGRPAACVGVINEELRTTTYTVHVAVAGMPAQRFGPITLAAGASWRRTLAVGPAKPAVTATLNKAGTPATAVYRRADLADWNIPVRAC